MSERTSTIRFFKGGTVQASILAEAEWAVGTSQGDYTSGNYAHYFTPSQAREFAAALVACADHYDAETARLAALAAEVAA